MNSQGFTTFFNSNQPSKGQMKKLEIIQAAIDCIASVGFEKTTYQAIADKLGTRRAHIAYHFKDKSDIFKASIHYINLNYERILKDHLAKGSKEGVETILRYAEAPFIWASENPKELSVMLLFYYLCTIDEDYRNLNDEIRTKGVERMILVLTQECKIDLPPVDIELKAKQIQNLVSGSIIDAVTTGNKSLKDAKAETIKNIMNLFSH